MHAISRPSANEEITLTTLGPRLQGNIFEGQENWNEEQSGPLGPLSQSWQPGVQGDYINMNDARRNGAEKEKRNAC
mgnify:CR=1 FL=1